MAIYCASDRSSLRAATCSRAFALSVMPEEQAPHLNGRRQLALLLKDGRGSPRRRLQRRTWDEDVRDGLAGQANVSLGFGNKIGKRDPSAAAGWVDQRTSGKFAEAESIRGWEGPPRLLVALSCGSEWLDALIKTAAPSAREAIPAEAIPAVRVSAKNAARIISFIGILHLWSGEMSGFDEG
jgi:hypothetical protein